MNQFNRAFFIISLSLTFSAYATEKHCEKPKVEVIGENNLANINTVLTSLEMNLEQKQKAFEEINLKNAKAYLSSLPLDKQRANDDLIKKINDSKNSLVPITDGDGDPVLLVDGIDPSKFPHEWVKPFNKLMDKKQSSYFFKWDKFNSIEKNRDQLMGAIKDVLEKHKNKKLTIIGYSAGGVLTVLAMEKLSDGPLAKRIQFNTVASPLFGYKAPGIAWLGAPFYGKTTIQIGVGNYDNLVHKQMSQCNHWVNTNCEMDKHTCERDGLNPQIGPHDQPFSLPCGKGHINRIDNESHASIVNRAFDEIVK